jgi:hypothetical protein
LTSCSAICAPRYSSPASALALPASGNIAPMRSCWGGVAELQAAHKKSAAARAASHRPRRASGTVVVQIFAALFPEAQTLLIAIQLCDEDGHVDVIGLFARVRVLHIGDLAPRLVD